MVKHEKRNDLFLWPGQSDIQIVKREDIILRLEQPPVPVDRSHFKVPQGNSILKT